MFYTIVSRTIITKINTPRDYLYIFLIGSVGYIALHWYLNMEKRSGIQDKLREYLYYIMAIDIVTAFTLMTMYPGKQDTSKGLGQKNNEDNEGGEQQYTAEQRKVIMQRMQEARRLQQMRQKEFEQQQKSNERSNDKKEDNNDLPNVTSRDAHSGENKKSIFTKSEEVRESNEDENEETDEENEEKNKKDLKVKNKKRESKEESAEDTDIPIFEGQRKDKK